MALTRKFLKAMGIEEEKIDQIIEAHAETADALKSERDKYRADAEKLADVQKKLDEANETIAKHGDGETVAKEDYDKLKKEYDDYKTEIGSKETLRSKQAAYRELAKDSGLSEKGIEKAVKYANFDEVELDKDGKIKDAEKHAEGIKKEWGDFVETTTIQGAPTANPPANNGKGTGKTREEIMAIKDPATRQAEIAKNPQAFGLKFD